MKKPMLTLALLLAASCGGPLTGNAQIINDRLEAAMAAEDACRSSSTKPLEESLASRPARELVARPVFKDGNADAQRLLEADKLDAEELRRLVSSAVAKNQVIEEYAMGARSKAADTVSLSHAIIDRVAAEVDGWGDAGAAAADAWAHYLKAATADEGAFEEVRKYREVHDMWTPSGADPAALRRKYRMGTSQRRQRLIGRRASSARREDRA